MPHSHIPFACSLICLLQFLLAINGKGDPCPHLNGHLVIWGPDHCCLVDAAAYPHTGTGYICSTLLPTVVLFSWDMVLGFCKNQNISIRKTEPYLHTGSFSISKGRFLPFAFWVLTGLCVACLSQNLHLLTEYKLILRLPG